MSFFLRVSRFSANAVRTGGVGGVAVLLGATVTCAEVDPTSVHVHPRLDFAAPRALFARASKLALTVYENAACSAETGAISTDGRTRQLVQRDLRSDNCPADVRFCGDIVVARSAATRTFAAVAQADDGARLAVGCADAAIDSDTSNVAIRLRRVFEDPVCGDGRVTPTEQCEPPNTPTCDEYCRSRELLLSIGSSQTGTRTGTGADKSDAAFVFPPAAAGGRFFAFYTDKAVASANNVEVALRALADDLTVLTTPPALAAGSIYLPNGGAFPPPPAPRNQSRPAVAVLRDHFYVAFEDDFTAGANGPDIHVRSMDSALVTDQGTTPLGINGPSGAGEANIQEQPAISAGPSSLLVAWTDAGQGKIWGRTLTPPATLGAAREISAGAGNRRVAVAALPGGWVAVWETSAGIAIRFLDATGELRGAADRVDQTAAAGEQPAVASLADGRFAVSFTAGGDVYVQRYTTAGVRIDGDQSAPINDLVTDDAQTAPAIAATAAGGGAFAVAWHDASTNHVRARMVGGSAGFLFNSVTGQASEFQASLSEGRIRARPVAAAGPSGEIVIGWEDRSASNGGIVARRFPPPEE